jgi:alpha-beta hydrolase superfamily lysophospholipase
MATLGHASPRPTLPEGVWPARAVEPLTPIHDATPDKVYLFKVKDGVDPATLSDAERTIVEKPHYEVAYKGIHGVNLLRLFKEDAAKPGDLNAVFDFTHLFVGFKPNGAILSSRTLDSIARRRALEKDLNPVIPVVAPDAKAVAKVKLEGVDSSHLYLDDGLPVRIPPAKDGFRPKGLVIHLQSLGGNEYEPKVLQEFERRGWAVIDLKGQTSIMSPISQSSHGEIRALGEKARALAKEVFVIPATDEEFMRETASQMTARIQRHPKYKEYMEVQTRLGKLRQGGYQACSDADLPGVAAEIAASIDQGMAGAAYAVETILDYVDTHRPDLQNIPVVLAGFSAGALTTPTIAARLEETQPGRIQAVVLVGGGCNLFRLAMESTFSNGGLRVLCGEKPATKQTINQISDLYLAASKLDPYHTAPLITHLPILVLHASSDTWVPAAMGELLYERLDYPERLVMSGGHEHLFYFLPGRAKWIVDWTEKKVQQPRSALAPSP